VQRVNAQIQTGNFHDADEVLEKPLMRLKIKRHPNVARATAAGGEAKKPLSNY
jgi:hypothetical protein